MLEGLRYRLLNFSRGGRVTAVAGVAGASGFGTIQSGALEESNADTTAALVDMITAERNFQANAQMIQTENNTTQAVINIHG